MPLAPAVETAALARVRIRCVVVRHGGRLREIAAEIQTQTRTQNEHGGLSVAKALPKTNMAAFRPPCREVFRNGKVA
jgi:hypothetical protein